MASVWEGAKKEGSTTLVGLWVGLVVEVLVVVEDLTWNPRESSEDRTTRC